MAMKTGFVTARGGVNRDVQTMQIDRRITNGLAWAGVLLVVGVPTADLLSAQFMGERPAASTAQIGLVEEKVAVVQDKLVAPVPAQRSQRPAEKPVEVAIAQPVQPVANPAPAKPVSGRADPVDDFVQSGKPMPSYITDAPAPLQAAPVKPAPALAPVPSAAAPAPAAQAPLTPAQPRVAALPAPAGPPALTGPAPAATVPVQTAAIAPKVAPTPMPLSMRPRAVAVAPINPGAPPATIARSEPVFVPPSVQPVPPAQITAEDLEDWETGPLADFLARRQGGQVPQQADAQSRFSDDEEAFFEREDEEEAFFEREQEFRRRDRLVGPEMFFYQ
ncbi:MAG: hypothetical protein JWP99_726 [Devosia sp.]|nr:hypothetical protein [Devosia sp.]